MKSLKKGLFRVNDEPVQLANKVSEPKGAYEITQSFEDEGFVRAGNMRGSQEGLSICLNRIYQEYKAEIKEDQETQDSNLRPHRVKIKEREGHIERLRSTIEKVRDEKIPAIKQQIERLQQQVAEIKREPEKIIGDTPGRASFLIGILILICLSVYLFIFYSSASYSAFFKQFTFDELGVANSIFDAQALSKALQDGLAELVLILMMPFVFLGLGFLIHKFQQAGGASRYFKVAFLIAVTFVFDAILAYEITSKIYHLEALQQFAEPATYALADAAQDVKFWLIIFAGFLVYLIWGLVFDFIMDEHEKLDAVALAIKHKQEEIKSEQAKITDYGTQLDKMNQALMQHQTEIDKLNQIIRSTVFVPKEFERRITSFMVGWVHWLTANKYSEDAVSSAKHASDRILANMSPSVDFGPQSLRTLNGA